MGLSQELSVGELVVKSSKDHITIWEASILEKRGLQSLGSRCLVQYRKSEYIFEDTSIMNVS